MLNIWSVDSSKSYIILVVYPLDMLAYIVGPFPLFNKVVFNVWFYWKLNKLSASNYNHNSKHTGYSTYLQYLSSSFSINRNSKRLVSAVQLSNASLIVWEADYPNSQVRLPLSEEFPLYAKKESFLPILADTLPKYSQVFHFTDLGNFILMIGFDIAYIPLGCNLFEQFIQT